MKTLEQVIYIPIVISEMEKPKWDPLLFNDIPEGAGTVGAVIELSSGVSQFTSAFSSESALSTVRGELNAIISVEPTIEASVSTEISEDEALGEHDSFENDGREVGGQSVEGSDGESEGSGEENE